MPPLRIIFAGTPAFAAQHLQALIDSRHQLVAVYTQPDRPAGRGRKLTPSPVKQLALQHGLAVQQPVSLKEPAAQATLAAYGADLMVVVAYGLLLPQAVLGTPPLGCVNVHASLLPAWRGAAPIQRALLAGQTETGVTLMQMDAGLDTGPMLDHQRLTIEPDDTSASLHDRLARLGSQNLAQQLDALQAGRLAPQPQPAAASYAAKLTKAEGQIDWRQSAAAIALQVRGLNPWPVAFSDWQGHTLRLWRAQALHQTCGAAPGTLLALDKQGLRVACGAGELLITELQWPGAKAMVGANLVNLAGKMALGQAFT